MRVSVDVLLYVTLHMQEANKQDWCLQLAAIDYENIKVY